jgi:hypothetical protein
MTTKTLPLTQKDFTWVNMTPALMKKQADAYIVHKKKVYTEIKKILPENRTFLNTLYALERCDDSFDRFVKVALVAFTFVPEEVVKVVLLSAEFPETFREERLASPVGLALVVL